MEVEKSALEKSMLSWEFVIRIRYPLHYPSFCNNATHQQTQC